MRQLVMCAIITLLPSVVAHAQEQPQAADGLTAFTSKEGKFSIQLPGKPLHEATEVGKAKEVQHQFQVAGKNGVYLISYQDNPNLEGNTLKQLQAALHTGRDAVQRAFRGELLETKDIQLEEKHPGVEFRATIPQARGEARCRFYMVGTRLYQIQAIGTPEFVSSDQSDRVINSFKLQPSTTK
jgi:hypothetical protein